MACAATPPEAVPGAGIGDDDAAAAAGAAAAAAAAAGSAAGAALGAGRLEKSPQDPGVSDGFVSVGCGSGGKASTTGTPSAAHSSRTHAAAAGWSVGISTAA